MTITVLEAKTQLSITSDDDDTLLRALIGAAQDAVAEYTQRKLSSATYTQTFDGFKAPMVLDNAPVTSVTSVQYIDRDGVTQTADPSLYVVDTRQSRAKIEKAWGETWPDTRDGDQQTVTVTYVAGYEVGDSPESNPMPESLRQAALMIVGALYENRENFIIGASVAEVPVSAKFLMSPYRIHF